MRGVHPGTLTGLLALAALLVQPPGASAQERTMRFRPVPAESTARYEREDRAATRARAAAESAEAARARRSTVPAVPAVPGVPEIPEPPSPGLLDGAEGDKDPTVRSTSGDIVRFGSDVTVSSDQVVEGDVVSFGGDVEVRGHVTGDVQAMGGDLHLASTARVDGDVVCVGGTLREEAGSKVGGKRVTAGRTPGAKILFPMLAVVGTGVQMLVHVVALFIMLGIAWAFVKLAPERTRGALDTIQAEPGPSFIIGLLLWALIIPSVIALALVIALLCITIIGIPLAAAVALAYVAFFVLIGLWGAVVGYGVLGSRLYPRFKGGSATLLQAVIWGAVALHGMRIAGDLLHVVPVFGFVGALLTFMYFVICLALSTLGAGALVRGEYRRRSIQTWWARMRPPTHTASDIPPPPPAPPAGRGSGAEVIS